MHVDEARSNPASRRVDYARSVNIVQIANRDYPISTNRDIGASRRPSFTIDHLAAADLEIYSTLRHRCPPYVRISATVSYTAGRKLSEVTMTLKPVAFSRLVDHITEQLREAILSGELIP